MAEPSSDMHSGPQVYTYYVDSAKLVVQTPFETVLKGSSEPSALPQQKVENEGLVPDPDEAEMAGNDGAGVGTDPGHTERVNGDG